MIICTYNGASTLRACLHSATQLRHPQYEVLVVDDGSTLPEVAAICADFPAVRYLHIQHAGLSAARNAGAAAAVGEILAFTDDDCLVDVDWLTYLQGGFHDNAVAACGGPNIPPPPRHEVEALVATAPGGPMPVLLDDMTAEHLPGCNLAIRKSALLAIGGFHPRYHAAGDDVDICWRLRAAGGQLRFLPEAMVWHHRRFTVSAYLRQQAGYGHAEALLMLDHPQRFTGLGWARWQGRLHETNELNEGHIFYGEHGQALFQGIYQRDAGVPAELSLGMLGVSVFLLLLMGLWPLVFVILISSAAVAWQRSVQLNVQPLPLRARALHVGLVWLQPKVRMLARLRAMWIHRIRPRGLHFPAFSWQQRWSVKLGEWAFWQDEGQGREELIQALKKEAEQMMTPVMDGDAWQRVDVVSNPQAWVSWALITVTEPHDGLQRLTRVRGLLRVQPFFFLGGVALMIFAVWRFGFGVSTLLTGAVPLLLGAGLFGVLRWQLAGYVLDAAKRCHMTVVDE